MFQLGQYHCNHTAEGANSTGGWPGIMSQRVHLANLIHSKTVNLGFAFRVLRNREENNSSKTLLSARYLLCNVDRKATLSTTAQVPRAAGIRDPTEKVSGSTASRLRFALPPFRSPLPLPRPSPVPPKLLRDGSVTPFRNPGTTRRSFPSPRDRCFRVDADSRCPRKVSSARRPRGGPTPPRQHTLSSRPKPTPLSKMHQSPRPRSLAR